MDLNEARIYCISTLNRKDLNDLLRSKGGR